MKAQSFQSKMANSYKYILSYIFMMFILINSSFAIPHVSDKPMTDISVKVNQQNGDYTITSDNPRWVFRGSIGQALENIKSVEGKDAIGDYKEISFQWKSDNLYTGSIRYYRHIPVAFFSLDVPHGAKHIGATFPSFTSFPQSMHPFSYQNEVFAPHQFKLSQISTPWLFFNDQDEAFIISPASDFMVSKMVGNGKDTIASGLAPELENLPKDFSHKTILIVDNGIGHSWDLWGNTLMKLYDKKRPSNEADAVLKYFGYWTDNGADYYYNYDTTLGYARTLLALHKQYNQEGIPLGYMQLDSWWYEKSIDDPDGKPDADHKNKNLPEGAWNRYGGLMEYTADKFLFPHGLAWFQHQMKLPLVVHNRWIDPRSPYHQQYEISGYAAVDPAYWKHIADYLKSSGVICYEQDWLNYIYNKTPEMKTNLATGNAFTDGMANSMKRVGIDLQYCMLLPCFYLQGLKYSNLTTIRCSDDRFEQKKWDNFIYNSQFAYAIGAWPWCDVFKSHETGNMILAVLSAGAVGTGDAMGKEDKNNIMRACRTDGMLVKPDVPLVPTDQTYINDANHSGKPLLAWTYTKQYDIQTDYVFAFAGKNINDKDFSFSPSSLGMKGEVVIYNPVTYSAKKINASDTFSDVVGNDHYSYYIVAPFTSSGIAFLGDENKIAATGEQRIADIISNRNQLKVTVLFAKGEKSVTLHGYYEKPFKTNLGKLTLSQDKKYFTLELPAPKNNILEITVAFMVR